MRRRHAPQSSNLKSHKSLASMTSHMYSKHTKPQQQSTSDCTKPNLHGLINQNLKHLWCSTNTAQCRFLDLLDQCRAHPRHIAYTNYCISCVHQNCTYRHNRSYHRCQTRNGVRLYDMAKLNKYHATMLLFTTNITSALGRQYVTDWIGFSSVLRPRQHSIGYMGDCFYRSKDPTNSIKVVKEMLQKRKKTTKTTK